LTLTLLLLVFLLTGCNKIQDYKTANLTQTTNIANTTNSSIPIVITPLYIKENATNTFFFRSDSNCEFIVTPTNQTFLIDCGGSNYYEIIGKIKKLGIEHIDNFIVTTSNEDTTNIDKLVLKFRPNTIYQNGIPNSFEKYSILNISNITDVGDDLNIDDVTLIPSYKAGFLSKIEFNTLIIKIDEIIIMNNCYDECESRISTENLDILSLANTGNCSSNSLMFLIQIDPKSIIIDSDNLCANITDYVTAMDIKIYNRKISDIQVIHDGTGYQIRS
jgi:hypothetical protein